MQTHITKHVVVLHINYAYCPNKGQVNRKNIAPTEYKLSTVCPYNLVNRNRKIVIIEVIHHLFYWKCER